MSGYENALIVSMEVDGTRRDPALDRLLSATGNVLIGRQLALLPERDLIKCEVLFPRDATRSAEQLQAAVVAGIELLAHSSLSEITHLRRLEWLVVDDFGTGRANCGHALEPGR